MREVIWWIGVVCSSLGFVGGVTLLIRRKVWGLGILALCAADFGLLLWGLR